MRDLRASSVLSDAAKGLHMEPNNDLITEVGVKASKSSDLYGDYMQVIPVAYEKG